MPHYSSTIPGFYRLPLHERRKLLTDQVQCSPAELQEALDEGGLSPTVADKIVENVVGTYALPFGIALNFLINDNERWVPMVVEEPSVIAAASNAAQRVREGGGFRAEVVSDLMTAQIEVHAVSQPENAIARILSQKDQLLASAAKCVPGLIARGGGPRELEVRNLGEGFLVVHVHVDCRDAMGANLVNSIAEGLGPTVAELAQGILGLRILTNLCDRRRVVVTCTVPPRGLVRAKPGETQSPSSLTARAGQVAEAIEQASRFAELDPYRAATHNKGIMNGIDSVVIATGNDYRAVEAGAHAFAARSGTYRPLAIWRRDDDHLRGTLELPLALGTVGGTLRVHPTARLALKLSRIAHTTELAEMAASAGLASNLSALRALATEGIQRGHMALHARGVATLAGATNDEVELVAEMMSNDGKYGLEQAQVHLTQLRAKRAST